MSDQNYKDRDEYLKKRYELMNELNKPVPLKYNVPDNYLTIIFYS